MNSKIKIYIFNSASRAANYGIGTYIENLTKALSQAGCEYGLVFMHDRKSNEATISEKDGVQCITIPVAQMLKPEDSERYARNAAYLLRSFIPKEKGARYIFHLNFMESEILVKYLKKLFPCKIVMTVHYTAWSFALYGHFEKIKCLCAKTPKALTDQKEKELVKSVHKEFKMLDRADRVICVSEHTFQQSVTLGGFRKHNCTIIPNALKDSFHPLSESQKADLRQKYGIDRKEHVFVFAGRLDPIKGLKEIIGAFKALVSQYPHIRLLIAGEGDYNLWLKEAKDCWTRICFTGKVDIQTLFEFYSMADTGLICSVYDVHPYVVIEMMMHALPIITSDAGGLDESVQDGVSGLKVPVLVRDDKRVVDEKRLTEAMEYMLTHPQEARTLGDNARKRFLEKYELSLFREKMTAVYQSLTETK